LIKDYYFSGRLSTKFLGNPLKRGIEFYIIITRERAYAELQKPIILAGCIKKYLLKHSSAGFSFGMRCSGSNVA
jgi:hypothetical protein